MRSVGMPNGAALIPGLLSDPWDMSRRKEKNGNKSDEGRIIPVSVRNDTY
jgi:hypothetical protein